MKSQSKLLLSLISLMIYGDLKTLHTSKESKLTPFGNTERLKINIANSRWPIQSP